MRATRKEAVGGDEKEPPVRCSIERRKTLLEETKQSLAGTLQVCGLACGEIFSHL